MDGREGLMEFPIRLTVDELAALGRLRALPEGPRISPDDAAVEAGVRSLIARGLLLADPDEGRLELGSRLAELAVVVAANSGFLVLGSRPMTDPPRPGFSGRLIRTDTDAGTFVQTLVIEDERYPGVFEYGTLRKRELQVYLGALFELTDGQQGVGGEEGDFREVTINLRAGSGADVDPDLPQDWADTTLNSVLLVHSDSPRALTWAREEGRVWELRPSPDQSNGTAVLAVQVSSQVILRELVSIAQTFVGEDQTGSDRGVYPATGRGVPDA